MTTMITYCDTVGVKKTGKELLVKINGVDEWRCPLSAASGKTVDNDGGILMTFGNRKVMAKFVEVEM